MIQCSEAFNTSLSPVVIASRMRRDAGGGFVFLDNHRPDGESADPPLSVIGRRPWRTFSCRDGICRVDGTPVGPDVWAMLRAALPSGPDTLSSPLPGPDHLFGYLSYDLSLPLMEVPVPPASGEDPELPDTLFFAFDELVVHNHRTGQTWLAAGGHFRPAGESLADLRVLLAAPQDPSETPPSKQSLLAEPAPEHIRLDSNFSHDGYLPVVERIRDYIGAGDAYIVNLSRRIATDATRPVWDSYLRLRALSPVPYGAFFEADGIAGLPGIPPFAVLSASMERFLRIRGRLAETGPIKGTRPRGRTPEEDALLRRELEDSVKDHAELLMIVDLERNDLSRVCTPDSVAVRDLFRLEAYASVFHLDATVEGRLAPGCDAVHALAALFPGGSITGAPKKRSMEIISELEETRRGLYTGSLGWLAPGGEADFNILIRTLVRQRGRIWYSTGGGITWDSDAQAEYDETCDKARFLERVV